MMDTAFPGYHGVLLEIDLTAGKAARLPLSPEDARRYIGGRGLGMKLLADRLRKPGVDALSPENPLLFMPGPLCGFPVPSASRTLRRDQIAAHLPAENTVPQGLHRELRQHGGLLRPGDPLRRIRRHHCNRPGRQARRHPH